MQRTTVHLTPEMKRDLAKHSKKSGIPRAEIIRRALDAYLKKTKE